MTTAPREVAVRVRLRAGNWQAFKTTAPEVLVEGPARTGKTFAILLRLVRHAQDTPGYRGLITRKVAATLGATVLRTLEEAVLHEWDSATRSSALDHVHFFGGSQNEPAWYEFDNGSRIVVGGMDQPSKILGAEYDEIFYNQIEEGTVEDMETLLSRLSHGLLPNPCFIADCNPAFEKHWVLQRTIAGTMQRIKSYLKDNPAFYDDDGELTDRGQAYVQSISTLTGTRYQRLVLGLWVSVENAIYPTFDRAVHVRPLPKDVKWKTGAIGADQGRIHSAAAVAVKVDQYNRRWVVEAWGEPDPEEGELTARNVGRLSIAHGITRIRTDPTGAKVALATMRLVKSAEVNAADGSPGARIARTRMTQRLLAIWPGGIVPTIWQEQNNRIPAGGEEESPGLLFVEGAPGIDDLCDQIESYHYVVVETTTREERVVARVFDDLVAGMEDAIEELEDAFEMPPPSTRTLTYKPQQPATMGMRRPVQPERRQFGGLR